MLRTRVTARPLFGAMHNLKTIQKLRLTEIGFGTFIKMPLDGNLPGRLGHFVVDRFDPKKMEITLH